MHRALKVAALAMLGVIPATRPLMAQSAELAVIGGIVRSDNEEFDRVTSSSFIPPINSRQRGVRESGPSIGLAATFSVRGAWFAEIGMQQHGVERSISSTGIGDANGPFLVTTTTPGTVTSLWAGPAYRLVDGDRFSLRAVLAPALFMLKGEAYDDTQVGYNAPDGNTEVGLLAGLRARYWATDRIGVQLSIEDAMWGIALKPHPGDSRFNPDAYVESPPSHDIRLQLGAAIRLR